MSYRPLWSSKRRWSRGPGKWISAWNGPIQTFDTLFDSSWRAQKLFFRSQIDIFKFGEAASESIFQTGISQKLNDNRSNFFFPLERACLFTPRNCVYSKFNDTTYSHPGQRRVEYGDFGRSRVLFTRIFNTGKLQNIIDTTTRIRKRYLLALKLELTCF